MTLITENQYRRNLRRVFFTIVVGASEATVNALILAIIINWGYDSGFMRYAILAPLAADGVLMFLVEWTLVIVLLERQLRKMKWA